MNKSLPTLDELETNVLEPEAGTRNSESDNPREDTDYAKDERDETGRDDQASASSSEADTNDVVALPKFERRVHIDFERLAADGLVFPEEAEGVLRDQMRRIKRPVLDNAFGSQNELIPRGNIVMIASAMAGEGKTFTTINLALSIAAEKDTDVLLVDSDIAKPHTSEVFGLEDYTGVIDYLVGDVDDINDVIVRTDVPGLELVAAGRHDELASELLASKRMAELVEELAKNRPNTIVLFDSSPVLQTNESHVLSRLVGQIIFVVAANQTPTDAAHEAVALLGRDRVINVVFNGMRSLFGQQHYYGGYYGYQYGREKK